MKPKPIHYLIGASVVLNIALFIYAKPFAQSAPQPAATLDAKTPANNKTTASQQMPATEKSGQLWRELQSLTPAQLKLKLEESGFTADLVRDIVSNRIREIYRAKIEAITGKLEDLPYWISERTVLQTTQDQAKVADCLKLNLEENELRRSLFGANDDGRNYGDYAVQMRQRFGDLSDEKYAAMDALLYKATAENNKAYEEYLRARVKNPAAKPPSYNPERQQALREEIAKILTPEELREYDLRNSPASVFLKSQTAVLDLTEDEYRAIFPAYETFVATMMANTDNRETSAEAERQMQARLKQTLGDERYADYLQAKDSEYKKLNLIVQRLDLPLSAARAVVSVQNDLTARAAAIGSDTSLTADQRAAQYNALAQEAQSRITQTLGPRGYAAYRENSKNWIQTLESGKSPAK